MCHTNSCDMYFKNIKKSVSCQAVVAHIYLLAKVECNSCIVWEAFELLQHYPTLRSSESGTSQKRGLFEGTLHFVYSTCYTSASTYTMCKPCSTYLQEDYSDLICNGCSVSHYMTEMHKEKCTEGSNHKECVSVCVCMWRCTVCLWICLCASYLLLLRYAYSVCVCVCES